MEGKCKAELNMPSQNPETIHHLLNIGQHIFYVPYFFEHNFCFLSACGREVFNIGKDSHPV